MSRLNIGIDIASSANSVLYGSTASLVAGGYIPDLAADFLNEYYRTETGNKTFLKTIDHSATSNATMTGDYGPELVTNGDFSNGSTGWNVGTLWTVANGEATIVSTGAASGFSQNGVFEIGKAYEVTFKATVRSGSVKIESSGGGTEVLINTTGLYVEHITATRTDLYFNRVSSCNITIDNISVREVPKIQWRPHNLLTYSEDFSNAAWTKDGVDIQADTFDVSGGDLSLTKITEDTSTGFHYVYKSTVSITNPRLGFIVKDAGCGAVAMGSGTIGALVVNLSDLSYTTEVGSTTSVAPSDVVIDDLGDGAYSVEFTLAADLVGQNIYLYLMNGAVWANRSYTGDGSSGLYLSAARAYRSDLGGMADVPADERVIPSATKYVRTAGREVTGTELVTNGDGSDTTSWNTGNSGVFTSVSGAFDVENGDAFLGYAYQAIATSAGSVYQFRIDHDTTASTDDGFIRVGTSIGAGNIYSSGTITTTGTQTVYFTAQGSTTYIRFGNYNGVLGENTRWDNISVKEIDVNPASARYLPRRGHHVYNGSQWVNKGLLHESEARTNFIDESEASGLGVVRATTTAGSSVWIDGSSTMVKVVENTDTNSHAAYENPVGTFADNTVYTFSTYLKAGERSWAKLGIKKKTSAIAGAWFDLSGGVVGTIEAGASSATIEDCGNGIYRCSVSVDLETGANAQQTFIYTAIADNSLSYTGDGSSGLECYGLQFELGSTPSSYIPTSGSTVTRAAETLTIPSANLPWPSPEYIGPELVTNGTFDANIDGWTTVLGSASWSAGQISVARGSGNEGRVSALITCEIGKVYRFFLERNKGSTASTTVNIAINGTSATGALLTDNSAVDGSSEFFFVATQTSHWVMLRTGSGSDGDAALFDNISVKEINPLALSIQMSGEMTYADTGSSAEITLYRHYDTSANYIRANLRTDSTRTGALQIMHMAGSTFDDVEGSASYYSPGVNVPFNISSRHGSTFINGAVDGVALTANTTPVALPDLSSTDLQLGHDFMGTIDTFRVWAEDIGNTGIAEATEPSEEATLFLSFDGTETSYIDFEWSE